MNDFEIDTNFLARLENWRRAYMDKFDRSVSITFVFCQYLKATTERLHETEEERKKREEDELRYREDPPEPIDFKDADLFNDVWRSMPDYLQYLPVKKFIKIFVFGTYREYERMRQHAHISKGAKEIHWRSKILKIFKERVELESDIRKQLTGEI